MNHRLIIQDTFFFPQFVLETFEIADSFKAQSDCENNVQN